MNEVIRCLLERRAIRKYKPDQISEEELNAILEAGLYAPSAGGRQGVLFCVSQNNEVNETLGKINKASFYGKTPAGTFSVSKDQPSIADDVTIESAFYGAPTVITLFGVKGNRYSASDCSVAAENMMLAAHSLGLGSCLIGRAGETFASEYGGQQLVKWQIEENYEPIFHVILGYPNSEHPQAKPRKENRIIFAA